MTVHAADDAERSPALGPFLELLARDIAARSEMLVSLTEALFDRIEAITEGVVVEPDEPFEGEVDI